MLRFLVSLMLIIATPHNVSAAELSDSIEIDLNEDYQDPNSSGRPIHRSPTKKIKILLHNHSISFQPFNSTSIIEVVEIDTNILHYTECIAPDESTFYLPMSLSGTYIIRFYVGNINYWGIIDL